MSHESRHDSSAGSNPAPRQPDVRRRRFLIAFGAGAAGAAAAAPAVAGPMAAVAQAAPEPESTGYRETEHIRRYYASTRI